MRALMHGRSRSTARFLRIAMAAGLIAVALGSSPTLASDDRREGGHHGWAAVRAATARYHHLSVAQAAGYGLFPGCFANPAGGMGVHYVQFSSVADGTIDPLTPEALVYEPMRGGRMRLVAVEYIVIASSWTGSRPPTVLGHPLDFVDEPNEFGLPPFYELHAWLFKRNPNGLFNEWNPRVTCRYAR